MRCFFALLSLLLTAWLGYAKTSLIADTIKKTDNMAVFSISIEPRYPGGTAAFESYVTRNLHYPDAARLMCISGKVYVSFTVNSDGRVTDVAAINCLGAGCESEAVRVVQRSKPWKPGIINGKPVKMTYIIPIDFHMETRKIYMENLIASGYGFVFKINGKLYSVDDAERIMGKAFSPDKIGIAEPFDSHTTDSKFFIRRKKETYLISIKSS